MSGTELPIEELPGFEVHKRDPEAARAHLVLGTLAAAEVLQRQLTVAIARMTARTCRECGDQMPAPGDLCRRSRREMEVR